MLLSELREVGAGIRLFVVHVINLILPDYGSAAPRHRRAVGTCLWPLLHCGIPTWKSRKLRQVLLGVLFLGILILLVLGDPVMGLYLKRASFLH